MASIIFKNVGQGDSIIIEWNFEEKNKIGIIDCNLYENSNPILNYLSQKDLKEIEFIILSHFHYDHFSGFPTLFKYCFEKGIKIKWFLHTLSEQVLHIYNKLVPTKKVERSIEGFFSWLELLKNKIEFDISVNYHSIPIPLTDKILLSFFAPSEKTGIAIAKQIKRKVNRKEFCRADLNKFSTITYIRNNEKGILITSDAVKAHFRNLHNLLDKEIVLVQAPHHGSFANIYQDFWSKLIRKKECPAVFSVGYNPKDKLPNIESVKFFDGLGFEIFSTNSVYGISDYINQINLNQSNYQLDKKTQYLNYFSKLRKAQNQLGSNSKFEGDKKFEIFN